MLSKITYASNGTFLYLRRRRRNQKWMIKFDQTKWHVIDPNRLSSCANCQFKVHWIKRPSNLNEHKIENKHLYNRFCWRVNKNVLSLAHKNTIIIVKQISSDCEERSNAVPSTCSNIIISILMNNVQLMPWKRMCWAYVLCHVQIVECVSCSSHGCECVAGFVVEYIRL